MVRNAAVHLAPWQDGAAVAICRHLPDETLMTAPTRHADSAEAPIAAPASSHPPKGAAETIMRGLRGRCPACGTGRLFRAFLKVADHCPACGEELYHHRADDFPAYLDIVIVGHVLVPIVLAVETDLAPPMWLSMTLWPLTALVMALGLLQPIKGAVVAIQWFGGMHGFENSKGRRSLRRPPATRQSKVASS
jgi:uncharacterized protein (DUF983 family)